MITPVAINTIGYKYYIVFTIIGFCIPLSVYFLYPEVGCHDYSSGHVQILTVKSTLFRPWGFALRTLTLSSVKALRCSRRWHMRGTGFR